MQTKSTKRYVSMISLVFLVLFSVLNVWAPVIQAAVMKSPVDEINISRTDGTTSEPYQASDGMKVEVKWSAKEQIKSGDQFTIDMPKEFRKDLMNLSFPLKDAEGKIVGTCDMKNGLLTCTMGDYVDGKNNIKGSLFVEFYFALEAYDGVEKIPLEFNVDGQIVNKEVSVSNTTERPKPQPNTDNLLKWGSYNQEDPSIAEWLVYVNATGTEMQDLKLTDTLGPGHELITDSVVLEEAVFEDGYAPTNVKPADLSKIKINATKTGFTIEFPDSSKGYILRYKTKITNPAAKPHKNTVKLEGKNIETEEKVGQVFVSGGGGTGSGDDNPPSIEKNIVDENGKLVENQQLTQMDQPIQYQVGTHIPNDPPKYTSMVISDDLEDVLEVLEAKVYDQNGQDITSKGTLTIDKQKSEVTFTFGESFDYKSYEDQIINLNIKAKIKAGADLSSYVDKKIPNKAELHFDDKKLTSKEVTVTPPEPPKDGTVAIHKIDAENPNKGLTGAEFEVRNSADKVVAVLKTDENGFSVPQTLAPGTYKVYEKVAPEGYQKLTSPVEVTLQAGETKTIEIKNTMQKGQIELKKIDSENGGKALANAEFDIVKDGVVVEHIITDKDGKAISKPLAPGKYILKETKAPEGYQLKETEFEVNVTGDGIFPIKVENAMVDKGNVEITKVDKENGAVLAGVEFEVQNEKDKVVRKVVTDKDGKANVSDLSVGKYKLVETKSLPGYKKLTESVSFEIKKGMTTVLSLKVENEQLDKGSVEITKVDKESQKVLEGVVFEVQDEKGKVVTKVTTNKDGKATISDLSVGKYKLVEKESLPGYKKLTEPVSFEIKKGMTEVLSIKVENEQLDKGSVEITKVDKESQKALKGVVFEVQDEAGTVVKELTTDKNGKANVSDLSVGKYKLVEKAGLPGYKKLTEPLSFEITKGMTEVLSLKIENEMVDTGNVEITKIDKDNKAPLAGVTFGVQDEKGNEVKKVTTDKDGKANVSDLPVGKYELVEVESLPGYKKLEKPVSFEITKGMTKSLTFTVENEMVDTGNVEITKIDKDSKAPLEGVVFEVRDSKGKVVKKVTTDKDGKANVSDLSIGKYELVEVETPAGYKPLEKPISFEIEKGRVTALQLTVENELVDTGNVEITKVDKENKDALADAVFEIQDEAGQVIAKITTDKKGHAQVTNLSVGTYKLVEVNAPKGYKQLVDPITFQIEKGMTKSLALTVENEMLDKGNVEITKVDKEGQKALAGVVFEVQDEAGKVVTEVTTDKDGKAKVSDLSVGKYKLVEKAGLPGYKKLTEPVSFEIKKGMTKVLSLKVENELLDKGSVEITKVDKESGAVLAGVTFEVQDEKDKVVTKVTTDKDGKATISDLSVGKYKLVEVESLPGYKKLAKPVSFEIKKGMTEVLSLKVENEKLDKGSVEITKVDKDSQKVLEGVVFEVQDEQGKVVTEVTTDKEGKAKISDLSVGKYKLVEKAGLPGYKKLTEPVSFEITKGMTTVLSIKVENEQLDKGSVEITKVDKDSQKVLAGVVFEVQDEQGKVVTEVTTDKDGKAKVSDLSVGKYKLVEKAGLPGYKKLTEPVSFEITKGMTKVLSLKVENELLDKGSVEITKVDKESGAVLAGVTFEVQDEKDKVVTKVTTDKDGKATISDLSVGKYKLVEVESLPGYKNLAKSVSFEIKKGMTEVLSLKVENELVDKGSVEITKVDKESGAVLEGVTFEVQDEKGKVVTKVTTDKEGKAKISDLSVGKYKLVEKESLPGYKKLTEPVSFEIKKGMTEVLSIKVENEQLDKGSVEITKVDKDSEKALEGVVFEVQDEQGKVVTEVKTDKEGKAKISDLSVGKYKLVEKESLPGYKKLPEPVSFEIKKGMTEVLSLKIENEMVDTGNVEITKIDKDNKAPLAGVVFEVQDETGKVVTKVTTDKKGKANVSDLSVGKYKLVEVESLPGYKKLEKPVPFEIKKGMTKSLAFTVENEMMDTGNVEITKIDKDSKAPLQGVVFEVRDSKGKVVTKVTTDKDGKANVSDLSIGKYELVEVETPAGYKPLEKPISFEIEKGRVTALQLTVENELVDTGNVEITKVDKETKDALADAVFEIQDGAGQVVAKITTDKKGHAQVTNLSVGTYKLVEVKAPKGYKQLVDPITFQIEKGMTKSLALTVENEMLDKGNVEITKVDKDSQKVLEGVVFEVQDEQGKVVTEVKTDREGKVTISDLSVGKYKLVEKESLPGYKKLTEPVLFEIKKGMTEVLSLKVENELLDKGSVEITKVDKESGAILAGVTFEVQDEKGKVVTKVTTDQDGKAKISDLSVGKYKLVEKESLPGYKKLTEPVSFEIKKGMTKVLSLKVENELLDKGSVEITKVDKESGTVLEGVTFEVQDEKGKVVTEVTTDKEGKATISDLSVGKYKLVEKENLPGYKKLTEPVSFEITKGMTTVLSMKVENEQLDKGSVEITKVDKDSQKALAGVVFEVQDEQGKVVTEVTTDKEGKATISDLSVGKYKLVEKENLPGYKKLTEPVSFEITKGMTKVLSLKVENEQLDKGSVEITKMAAESKNILAGAVFEVHDEKGKIVARVTTDKDGKAKVSDLSVGNYTLVEVEAPKGYEKLTNPIPFEITKGMISSVQLEVLNKLSHLAPPNPEKPETTDPEKPEKPDPEKPEKPDPEKPGTTDPEKPETTDPEKPGTTNPEKPGTTDPEKPGTTDPEKPGTTNPEKPGTTNPEKPEKELPKTGQKMPVEPYMGALLVMMSFGLLVLGRKKQG
ncbi:SpaA isopeptide-forming pilin-related protein [Bacillus mycoides]|uniref:SpaA isopeptide-forming pilin-related protein n=5 Tax=Bacillus mycoides TaxID=1405 RepID=UPI0030811216